MQIFSIFQLFFFFNSVRFLKKGCEVFVLEIRVEFTHRFLLIKTHTYIVYTYTRILEIYNLF